MNVILAWGNTCKTYLNKLVKLQKWASQYYRSHTEPIFSKYNILTVNDMYHREPGAFMYKPSTNGLPNVKSIWKSCKLWQKLGIWSKCIKNKCDLKRSTFAGIPVLETTKKVRNSDLLYGKRAFFTRKSPFSVLNLDSGGRWPNHLNIIILIVPKVDIVMYNCPGCHHCLQGLWCHLHTFTCCHQRANPQSSYSKHWPRAWKYDNLFHWPLCKYDTLFTALS